MHLLRHTTMAKNPCISALFLWALVTEAGALFDDGIKDKPLMCRRQMKVECNVETCPSDQVECYHGTCSQHTGKCVCFPCWTGDSCDIPENLHLPKFKQRTLEVEFHIKDIHRDDNISKVLAQDADVEKCALPDCCPCGDIVYSIERGNVNGLFMIDPKNGVIQLSDKSKAKLEDEVATFELKVYAKNPVYGKRLLKGIDSPANDGDDTVFSEAIVQIVLRSGEKTEPGTVHSRKRRSVASGVPEKETFTLQKLTPFTNTTDIRLGESVSLRLTIWLPVQTTNMSVELQAPYESSAVMVLCNPSLAHIGSNYLSFDIVPQFFAHGRDFRYNRILMDLGSITNNGTNTTDEVSNKIHLDFTVILQDNNATHYGEDYVVSARVTYGRNYSEVWVGKVTFTPVNDTDDWPVAVPQITISGPSTLATHTLAIFNIYLVLKSYVTDFYVDVVTADINTSNPVMKICEFQLVGKGENYECTPNELPKYTSVKDNVTDSTILARLDFGKVVNTGLRDEINSDAANNLSMEARVYFTNSSDIVHGGIYWFNATLTVDGTKTYSSQHAVTVLTTSTPSMNADPTIQLYTVDGNSVTIGGSVGFIIGIDIPEHTASVYTVDLSMPYTPASGSILAICWAKVVYVGHNIPCVGNVKPNFSRQDGKSADYVEINLGGITNLGRRGLINDNKLKILVTSELLASHPDVSDGTEFSVTAGVSYKGENGHTRLVSNLTVTAVDYQHHEYTEAEKLLKFSLINRGANYFIYNNSAVSFNITVTVPPGTTYTPLLLNISGQRGLQDGMPMIGICRVEVVKIGPDLHCYNSGKVSMTNTSSKAGVTQEYLVDLGVVTNSLEVGLQKDPRDSSIDVQVIVHWMNHHELVHDQNVTVTVKATYGSNGTWQGSMCYIARFDRPKLPEDNEQPQFELAPGQNSSLRPGSIAVFQLMVLTPLNSEASYQVDITSSSLRICRARLTHIGHNIPCFSTDRPTQYPSSEKDGRQDKAVLDIGPVRNIGFKPVADTRDNAIVVQILVKPDAVVAMTSPSNLSEPAIHEFEVTVRDGDTVLYNTSKQIQASIGQDEINSTEIPVVRFTKLDAESPVIVGGAAVFNLDIYIPYGSVYDYKVRFFSNQTDLHRTTLCKARLIQSGWNVPCINGTLLTTIYNSTTGDGHIDTAYMDMGIVANMISEGEPVVSESNKVRVQLVAQLENGTIKESDQLWLSALLTVNGHHEQYLRVFFNATHESTYSETLPQPQLQISRPHDPVVMRTRSTVTYNLKITTPIMITPMALFITMPSALNEAYLTISGVQLIRIGVNYACHHVYKLMKPVYSSTYLTSQNNRAYVYLGVVTNHGTTHHYQYNPEYFRPEDDEIVLSLEVQLADHPNLHNGDTISFDVDFSFNSSGGVVSFNETVNVFLAGDERPVVGFNISISNYNPALTKQGERVLTELSIYHTDTSRSHAYGLVVYLMLPYYLEVDENDEIEGAPFSVMMSRAGVEFHLAKMFFTDVITLRFNISVDPHRLMPTDTLFINTTIPVEIVYNKRNGTDAQGNVILGKIFKTETIILDLTFRTEHCFDVLGIEDNSTIQDCQITASSYLNSTYTPQMARLNSKSGWAPVIREMKPYKGNDYLEIRFGGLHRFTGIRMQKAFNGSNCVVTFQLSYSQDGIAWIYYHHTFTNEYDDAANDTSSMNVISTPFNAAYIRVRPLIHAMNTKFPVMRVELYGCKLTMNIDLNAACATRTFSDYPYYERGFIVERESGSVFVCILEYIDGPTRCSYSLNNGTTWEAMDDSIANIMGFDPEAKELFGLSQNRRAIMRSGSLGVAWSSTSPEQYLTLSNSSRLIEAVTVPFEEISEEPVVTMATQGDNFFYEWGAAARGLYRREVIVIQGNSTPSDWELIGLWGNP